MSKHLFDKEKRDEAARIETLRGLLGQVEKPGFWNRLSQGPETGAAQQDSFQQAVERRADALGVSPESLLSSYTQQLRESTYPTADCLEADDMQSLAAASSLPTSAQAAHLAGCEACTQLLAACRQDDSEMDKMMARLQQSAAEAQLQLWMDFSTKGKFAGRAQGERFTR